MLTFDNAPTIYWFLGYVLAGLVIIASIYKKVPVTIFVILAIMLLTFMRMPALVFNRELNADESQMLSHAITLYQDPVYWRSVDGTTIGPLDNYLLVIPKLFGFQINYTTGRVMGLLCSIGALLFIFSAMKKWFGPSTARIAFTVPILFLSFTQEADFIHYSSEQLPVLLLAFTIWLLSKLTESKQLSTGTTFLLGFIAGMMPFAKLQSVPQAMVVVLVALWLCYQYYNRTKQIKPLLTLLIGGITFPVMLFVWIFANNLFQDFIDFYIFGNAIYAGENNFLSIPSQFIDLVMASRDFSVYSLVLIIPMILGLFHAIRPTPDSKKITDFLIPVIAILLILAGMYSATKSGNSFIHYLNFCIYPWILLAAYGISKRSTLFIAMPVLLILWFAGNDALSYRREHRLNAFESTGGANKLDKSEIVKALEKFTTPGDYMVVWGWQCKYYVEAQLAHGTAENHSERSIFKHPMQDKYLQRYVNDLQRTKPAVILDAVGKYSLWVQDKKTQGIDNFPAVSQYVHQHYTLVSTIEDVTLYVRKDKLTSLQSTAQPYLAATNH
jgi:hypothetical protein